MALKWCTKLEVAYKRCPIVFQGHPSNFKVRGTENRWFWPELSISGLLFQLEFTDGFERMQKTCSIEKVPYCFSRSSIKFQGHAAKKIVDFDPIWVFPDCNSSLNSPMVTKWCTKLGMSKKRCPIVFQGHPSNFKVTWDRKLLILTRIGHFRTVIPVRIHRWLWKDAKTCSIKKVSYCFSRSSTKFQGHTGWKIDDWQF